MFGILSCFFVFENVQSIVFQLQDSHYYLKNKISSETKLKIKKEYFIY